MQGMSAGHAGIAASQPRHQQKMVGPTWGAPAGPAGPAAAQRRQRRHSGGAAAAVLPGLVQGTGAGPAAAAGPCEGERGGDSRAQPAAAPSTPGQGGKRPFQQLLVSPGRGISVNDRAQQLRQQEPYPGARKEAAAAAAAAEAAGLGPFAAGPSARSEARSAVNTTGAHTAAATDTHVAAQVQAVAAPAEAMPAAATPARPRVSKRKAPSGEARPVTQPEPKLPAASPAAASTTPAGTSRAAVAAAEQASAVEPAAPPRIRQKRRHVGTAAVQSGQDSLQSGQDLVTQASRPGLLAVAQAGMGSTCRPSTSQADSGLDVPARQDQHVRGRGSARASGSGRVMPAQSRQPTDRGLHSSDAEASAPAPGTRGITTDDDCIDLSKLMMPAFRAPRTSASDAAQATNDVVIDLT